MSQLGQTCLFDRLVATSGVPRQADILRVIRHVAKVPLTEVVIRSPRRRELTLRRELLG
jgi:hypothetical protein